MNENLEKRNRKIELSQKAIALKKMREFRNFSVSIATEDGIQFNDVSKISKLNYVWADLTEIKSQCLIQYNRGRKNINTSLWLVFNGSYEISVDALMIHGFPDKWEVLRKFVGEKNPNIKLSPQIEPRCAKQVTLELLKVLKLERY